MTPCKDEWLGLVDVTPYSFQLVKTQKNLYNCTTELLQYNYIILHRCQCCAFCFHAELQFCSILSHFFRGRREWKKLLCSQRATIPVMHLLKWGSMGAFGKGCFLHLLLVSCKPVLACWNKIEWTWKGYVGYSYVNTMLSYVWFYHCVVCARVPAERRISCGLMYMLEMVEILQSASLAVHISLTLKVSRRHFHTVQRGWKKKLRSDFQPEKLLHEWCEMSSTVTDCGAFGCEDHGLVTQCR